MDDNERYRTSQTPPAVVDAAVRRVCDAVGEFIAYWGFKGIHGRLWTLLALRREPMSQVEIAEFFDVSRSLVSGAVAELTRRNLVRARSDHRNAPYEAVIDVWPSIADVLRQREWMLVESSRITLETLLDELESSRGKASVYDAGRVRMLLRMTELSQGLLRVLIGLRVPRRLEGLTKWLRTTSTFLNTMRG